MIPVGFEYERATTIDEALSKLSAGGKLIAGGHSLVPLMKLRLSEPGRLIDISKISALSGIRETAGGIEIGSTTVHHQLATSALLQSKCPMIADAAAEIGDPQVRNRGTIGGSLAHADPASDLPAVVVAADAELVIQGTSGQRRIKAPGYFIGFCTVALGGAGVRLRQAPSARVALRDCRSGGSARHQEWRDPIGARRFDRRDDTRHPARRRGAGVGWTASYTRRGCRRGIRCG